jgi:DNA-binding transcriptional LysR family regulator
MSALAHPRKPRNEPTRDCDWQWITVALASVALDEPSLELSPVPGRYPKLTPAGVVLLADARNIITGVDLLKARAKGMAVGLEPELSVVVDVFYPIDAITQVAKEFRGHYPGVALRIYVEALGAAIQPVLDGRCSVGVIGSLPIIPGTLTNERLPGVAYLMVAAVDHPLASYKSKIPKEILGKHTQIVLADRSESYLPGAKWVSCRRRHGA